MVHILPWPLTSELTSPVPRFVNSTVTFRFQMRFTNPRRPPLDYENNWIMLHSQGPSLKDDTTLMDFQKSQGWFTITIGLDVQNKTLVNNGMNYQAQLAIAGFLNHQQ